jgi:hypothetical protein
MLQSPFGAQNSPQGFAESARRFTVGLKFSGIILEPAITSFLSHG